MSFLAKLELDGNTYNILSCDYNFTQQIDATGKPEGMPQGGEINIRIESNGKSNLLQWMLDHSQTKNGTITFFRRDAMSKLQELKFEKAYCVSFSEYFDAIPGKNVMLFAGKNDQTAAHEFLHSFKLPHTFANKEADANAKFTFEYTKTENLLDYSHMLNPPQERYTLWQWIIANGSIT
nr:type VI secretion system tube protein TssD [Flavobacterium covae]